MASRVARHENGSLTNYHCPGYTSYNNSTMDLLQEDRYRIITFNLMQHVHAYIMSDSNVRNSLCALRLRFIVHYMLTS